MSLYQGRAGIQGGNCLDVIKAASFSPDQHQDSLYDGTLPCDINTDTDRRDGSSQDQIPLVLREIGSIYHLHGGMEQAMIEDRGSPDIKSPGP